MSSKIPVAYIDIRAFAHATEDADKVLNALHNALPTNLIEAISFEKMPLTGHHGNSIVLFKARIKERKAAQEVLRRLSSSLGIMDKDLLGSEIQQHVEKGNLYLRLDKQAAYMNELRLCKTDPIHLRIHFRKHGFEEVVGICRESGLLP